MLRNKLTLLLVTFATVALVSCNESFLETEPTEYISDQKLEDISKIDPELQAANIAGIYATMFTVESGGAVDSHIDFGQKSYDIFADMQSGDMVLRGKNYGWYSDFSDRKVFTDVSQIEHYMVWRYYYRIIFSANAVINALSNPEGTDVPEKEVARHYLGQALAMRAYAFFYLTQFHTTKYDPTEAILPLYLSSETMNLPLSTQQEVFNRIITDLENAIVYLETFTRNSKAEVNKYVAEGLLAYTHAYIGLPNNLEQVLTLTKDVIDNGGFTPMPASQIVYIPAMNYTGGFNDVNSSGWMWGADITLENGLDLISWWGQVDYFTYSYAAVGDYKGINSDLLNSMRPDDIRRNQFHPAVYIPWNKFYDPNRKPMGQRNIETDYVYMRVAEMYLLHAETLAKLGRDGEAISLLKSFLADRISDLSYLDALSGESLQKEIWLQTRIELWGEGKSLMALKRNKGVVRFGANHLDFPNTDFSYDDPTMEFMIPENELLNNPSL